MQTTTTIKSCRQVWELAGIQASNYCKEIDTEDLVDAHVKTQLDAISLMAKIRTFDLGDMIIKLQTWKEESYIDDADLGCLQYEALLVLSVLTDLQALQDLNVNDTHFQTKAKAG